MPGAAKEAAGMSRAAYKRQIDMLRDHLPFAETAPEVMAIYLTSDCLWLAGFAPSDQTDGTSLSILGLRVNGSSSRLMRVRVPAPDGRLRHVDARDIYVSSLDSLGQPLVERFPIAEAAGECGGADHAVE